jgi:hypothetical protein
VNPRAADLIRKTVAGLLSIAVTVLLFRVMFRAASGRVRLLDPELWTALALLVLGYVWVRAARRVHQAREETGEGPPPTP